MGACASCLGLNRHPSHDELDESDPLLDTSQTFGYGSTVSQPDEDELQREREIMDRITSEATENMIDVLHPHVADAGIPFAPAGTHRSARPDSPREDASTAAGDDQGEEDEGAWWQSIQAADADGAALIKGLDSDTLVMDINQLKDEAPASNGRRSVKTHGAI